MGAGLVARMALLLLNELRLKTCQVFPLACPSPRVVNDSRAPEGLSANTWVLGLLPPR